MSRPRIGSLFSGYGGLEIGIQAAIGGDVAWHCENEPAAITVLKHHHPDIPNLGDITAVDWSQVEQVNVLAGGFPCTDVSSAGKRAGLRPGTRSGLWTHMAYAIAELRPALVVIENVRGLLSTDAHCDLEPCPWCLGDNEGRPLRALGAVLGDLATLGYVGRWHGLRAADVGAPHGRFRIFITACPASHTDSLNREGWATAGLERETGPATGPTANTDCLGPVRAWGTRERRSGPADSGAAATDPESIRRGQGRPEPTGFVGGSDVAFSGDGAAPDADITGRWPGSGMGQRPGPAAERNSAPLVTDTESTTRRGPEPDRLGQATGRTAEPGERPSTAPWGEYTPAIHRWERTLNRPAPPPTLTGKRGGQQLSPRFVEWMQGLPDGWVTDVPGLSRNDQLKLLGNGVVPQQAAAALSWLLSCEECVA